LLVVCPALSTNPSFEIFGKEGSRTARDLALKALKNFSADNTKDKSKKEEGDGDPEKRTQLLLFLWSVENDWMNKVGLSEPPVNNIFDFLAQKTTRKLDKEETFTKENPKAKERTTSDEHQHPKSHWPRSLFLSANQITLPSNCPRHSKAVRTKSQKPFHGSWTGCSLQNFANKEEREERRRRKGRHRPSPSPLHSNSSSSSSPRGHQEKQAPAGESQRCPGHFVKISRGLFQIEVEIIQDKAGLERRQ
jgi:hypothetical protein